MAELQQRLQAAVGDTYRIERELGGGGMSRVFLAEEVRLGRKVVIKVLPPEMGAGVNVERFEREIQLAAKLQHPHVVPLLTAGASDDLLYYMMPFIEGESLRAKLAREGELPIGEVVRILKEVVDALAYAHEHGVVHRDIKPDNVLLSGKHAVVTDFGVAKAVSASTGESNLTSLGVALGTPAYMAPEQAVADPHVDHRADIYAVGAMAYEMLTGRPPFTGPNPQAVLSAHVTDAPEPAAKYRETVPQALNELVMRCLQKKAADRWQKAEEMLPHLDAVLTPTGGITPTGTQPVPAVDYEALARQAHPIRVAALFGLGSAVALALVYWIMIQAGLPDWVFVGAVILLVIGLPIMVMTGHHERQRALASTTGVVVTTPQQGIRRWFTWRKSLMGGGVAFVGLGVVAAVYMAMRAMGVGPAATLVTSGVLDEGGLIILADFDNRTPDTTLGSSVTELLRVDLTQSPMVRLMDPAQVAAALQRMERDPATAVDRDLAMEIAEREGIKAVVVGEIFPVGTEFALSTQLVAAGSGQVLAAFRATAEGAGSIIGAVDGVSAKLRERIGESLRTIRSGEPLIQVTTASLEALRKFSQAVRAQDVEADYEKSTTLLEEAIALDSGFAMAYRKLGVALANLQQERAKQIAALTKAFEHRDRLPYQERYMTIGTYYGTVRADPDKAIAAYETLLERHPDDYRALNNLGNEYAYSSKRKWAEAELLYLRAVEAAPHASIPYEHAIAMPVALGRFADAAVRLELMAEKFPDHPDMLRARWEFAAAQKDYDGAEASARSLRELQRGNLRLRAFTSSVLADVAKVRGKLAEARSHLRDRMRAQQERGLPSEYLEAAVDLALLDIEFTDSPAEGLRQIETALERYPTDSLAAGDRPYLGLAYLYARAGRPDRASAVMSEYESEIDEAERRANPFRFAAAGALALAEGRPQDAIAEFRSWDESIGCPICALADLAQAYDQAAQPDSAVAVYERFVTTPWLFGHLNVDSWNLATSYKRLGELYEERGENEKAVEYYDKFVELWKDADAELQPVVQDVRERIARLVGER